MASPRRPLPAAASLMVSKSLHNEYSASSDRARRLPSAGKLQVDGAGSDRAVFGHQRPGALLSGKPVSSPSSHLLLTQRDGASPRTIVSPRTASQRGAVETRPTGIMPKWAEQVLQREVAEKDRGMREMSTWRSPSGHAEGTSIFAPAMTLPAFEDPHAAVARGRSATTDGVPASPFGPSPLMLVAQASEAAAAGGGGGGSIAVDGPAAGRRASAPVAIASPVRAPAGPRGSVASMVASTVAAPYQFSSAAMPGPYARATTSIAGRGFGASDPDVVLMAASEGLVYFDAFHILDEDGDGWIRPGEVVRFVHLHGMPHIAEADALEVFVATAALQDRQEAETRAASMKLPQPPPGFQLTVGGGLDYYRFVRVMRGDTSHTFKRFALNLARMKQAKEEAARARAGATYDAHDAAVREGIVGPGKLGEAIGAPRGTGDAGAAAAAWSPTAIATGGAGAPARGAAAGAPGGVPSPSRPGPGMGGMASPDMDVTASFLFSTSYVMQSPAGPDGHHPFPGRQPPHTQRAASSSTALPGGGMLWDAPPMAAAGSSPARDAPSTPPDGRSPAGEDADDDDGVDDGYRRSASRGSDRSRSLSPAAGGDPVKDAMALAAAWSAAGASAQTSSAGGAPRRMRGGLSSRGDGTFTAASARSVNFKDQPSPSDPWGHMTSLPGLEARPDPHKPVVGASPQRLLGHLPDDLMPRKGDSEIINAQIASAMKRQPVAPTRTSSRGSARGTRMRSPRSARSLSPPASPRGTPRPGRSTSPSQYADSRDASGRASPAGAPHPFVPPLPLGFTSAPPSEGATGPPNSAQSGMRVAAPAAVVELPGPILSTLQQRVRRIFTGVGEHDVEIAELAVDAARPVTADLVPRGRRGRRNSAPALPPSQGGEPVPATPSESQPESRVGTAQTVPDAHGHKTVDRSLVKAAMKTVETLQQSQLAVPGLALVADRDEEGGGGAPLVKKKSLTSMSSFRFPAAASAVAYSNAPSVLESMVGPFPSSPTVAGIPASPRFSEKKLAGAQLLARAFKPGIRRRLRGAWDQWQIVVAMSMRQRFKSVEARTGVTIFGAQVDGTQSSPSVGTASPSLTGALGGDYSRPGTADTMLSRPSLANSRIARAASLRAAEMMAAAGAPAAAAASSASPTWTPAVAPAAPAAVATSPILAGTSQRSRPASSSAAAGSGAAPMTPSVPLPATLAPTAASGAPHAPPAASAAFPAAHVAGAAGAAHGLHIDVPGRPHADAHPATGITSMSPEDARLHSSSSSRPQTAAGDDSDSDGPSTKTKRQTRAKLEKQVRRVESRGTLHKEPAAADVAFEDKYSDRSKLISLQYDKQAPPPNSAAEKIGLSKLHADELFTLMPHNGLPPADNKSNGERYFGGKFRTAPAGVEGAAEAAAALAANVSHLVDELIDIKTPPDPRTAKAAAAAAASSMQSPATTAAAAAPAASTASFAQPAAVAAPADVDSASALAAGTPSIYAADSRWMECADPASGMVYFYSTTTGESAWELPSAPPLDMASAPALQSDGTPAPADGVSVCVECEARAAARKCWHCGGDLFCNPCFASFHAKGRKRMHEFSMVRQPAGVAPDEPVAGGPAPMLTAPGMSPLMGGMPGPADSGLQLPTDLRADAPDRTGSAHSMRSSRGSTRAASQRFTDAIASAELTRTGKSSLSSRTNTTGSMTSAGLTAAQVLDGVRATPFAARGAGAAVPGAIRASDRSGIVHHTSAAAELRDLMHDTSSAASAAAVMMERDDGSRRRGPGTGTEVRPADASEVWQAFYDQGSTAAYYFNPATAVTQWEVPLGATIVPMTPAAALYILEKSSELPEGTRVDDKMGHAAAAAAATATSASAASTEGGKPGTPILRRAGSSRTMMESAAAMPMPAKVALRRNFSGGPDVFAAASSVSQ